MCMRERERESESERENETNVSFGFCSEMTHSLALFLLYLSIIINKDLFVILSTTI